MNKDIGTRPKKFDDLLTINQSRVVDLLKRYLNLDYTWRAFVRGRLQLAHDLHGTEADEMLFAIFGKFRHGVDTEITNKLDSVLAEIEIRTTRKLPPLLTEILERP